MITAISDLEELRTYDSEWRKLAERCGNVFLTPEWFRCWFDHYGAKSAPFVPILRGTAGKVRGLFPLALARSGHPRVCRIPGADLGDHFHPLSDPGEESEVGAAVGEALASAPEPWSILALHHVDLQRGWLPALAAGTGLRLRARERNPDTMPRIDLSVHENWDAYLAALSSKLRYQIRKSTRRLADRHSVQVRRTETAEEVRSDMSTFFDLHARRYPTSALGDEQARAFHLSFAAAALERGWLRLWSLAIDDVPAATFYGWRVGPRYLVYNQGFDPHWAKSSPGLVLLSAVLQSAFEEGASEFDFLRGDEPYKYRFADDERTISDVTLARSLPHPASLVASAGHGAYKARRLIRPRRAGRWLVSRLPMRGHRS
jgi:CelD/BcsL family acetyltransferase involved in cellulose biosynthesis